MSRAQSSGTGQRGLNSLVCHLHQSWRASLHLWDFFFTNGSIVRAGRRLQSRMTQREAIECRQGASRWLVLDAFIPKPNGSPDLIDSIDYCR
jgi:hypothetical protein